MRQKELGINFPRGDLDEEDENLSAYKYKWLRMNYNLLLL